jgi:hypothetical protein
MLPELYRTSLKNQLSQAQFLTLEILVWLLQVHKQGQVIKSTRQQKYIGRLRKIKQSLTKNSNFWLGLYGDVWIIAREFVGQWVEELMKVNLNKLPFYQKGIRAMNIIQQAF